MLNNVLSPNATLGQEKDHKVIPLQMSNSIGGPSSDFVISLKDKPHQNSKGKGPMQQENNAVLETPKMVTCNKKNGGIDTTRIEVITRGNEQTM